VHQNRFASALHAVKPPSVHTHTCSSSATAMLCMPEGLCACAAATECDQTCPVVRRRRPFLIRPLENTLIKLLRSLDFYDELGRSKIAMGAPGRHLAPPAPRPARPDSAAGRVLRRRGPTLTLTLCSAPIQRPRARSHRAVLCEQAGHPERPRAQRGHERPHDRQGPGAALGHRLLRRLPGDRADGRPGGHPAQGAPSPPSAPPPQQSHSQASL